MNSQVASFREIAKEVAEQWKAIDSVTKAYVEAVANIQKIRYHQIQPKAKKKLAQSISVSPISSTMEPSFEDQPPGVGNPSVELHPAFSSFSTFPIQEILVNHEGTDHQDSSSQFLHRRITLDTPYYQANNRASEVTYEVDLSDEDIMKAYFSVDYS